MMTIFEIENAVADAKRALEAAELAMSACARLLRGRLRKVQPYVLADLKRELKNFNIRTEKWNDESHV